MLSIILKLHVVFDNLVLFLLVIYSFTGALWHHISDTVHFSGFRCYVLSPPGFVNDSNSETKWVTYVTTVSAVYTLANIHEHCISVVIQPARVDFDVSRMRLNPEIFWRFVFAAHR